MPDARSYILLVIKAHPDFSRANSRLSSAIIQKQMCAKYRTLSYNQRKQAFFKNLLSKCARFSGRYLLFASYIYGKTYFGIIKKTISSH